MDDILGYDCDGKEIYEYRVLRAIWSNDIDIEELEDADPRQYCALVAEDGKAYAISVYDWWRISLIRERENIDPSEEVSVVVKPISDMVNYELAECSDGELYYDFDRDKLKEQLNSFLKKNKAKALARVKNNDSKK